MNRMREKMTLPHALEQHQTQEPTDKGGKLNDHDGIVGPLRVLSSFPLGGGDGPNCHANRVNPGKARPHGVDKPVRT